MIEMTESAVIVVSDDDRIRGTQSTDSRYLEALARNGVQVDTFHNGKITECEMCGDRQLCIATKTAWRCADWQACRKRQQENKEPMPIVLTPADQAALLERMEIMQADMERLKRIESAARVYVQASEAYHNSRTTSGQLHDNAYQARQRLIEAVKGNE